MCRNKGYARKAFMLSFYQIYMFFNFGGFMLFFLQRTKWHVKDFLMTSFNFIFLWSTHFLFFCNLFSFLGVSSPSPLLLSFPFLLGFHSMNFFAWRFIPLYIFGLSKFPHYYILFLMAHIAVLQLTSSLKFAKNIKKDLPIWFEYFN